MIVTDMRFTDKDKALLASLIGKRFEKYRIDEYVAGKCESSFGVVGLFVNRKIYALTAELKTGNYFGAEEDIAAVSFSETNEEGTKPRLAGARQTDWTVEDIIEDVILYEDRQILSKDSKDTFEYRWTGAIIFKMPHTEIAIEPDGWIMEGFSIYRGPGASKSIRSADSDIDEDERNYIRAERNVMSLRKWS